MSPDDTNSPLNQCRRRVEENAGFHRSEAPRVTYQRRAFIKYCCGQRMLRFRVVYMNGVKEHATTPWFSCPCCFNTFRMVSYP